MPENTVMPLKQWRNIKGLNQKQLAERSGVSEKSIGLYERDVRVLQNAQYSTIKKLSIALDIKVSNIFLGDTSENPK